MGVCVCVYMGFLMCGCVYVWVLQCVGVLVICVLVFTVFCIDSFVYIYSYLLLVYGLLPPSDNSIAVNTDNNNNITRLSQTKATSISVENITLSSRPSAGNLNRDCSSFSFYCNA